MRITPSVSPVRSRRDSGVYGFDGFGSSSTSPTSADKLSAAADKVLDGLETEFGFGGFEDDDFEEFVVPNQIPRSTSVDLNEFSGFGDLQDDEPEQKEPSKAPDRDQPEDWWEREQRKKKEPDTESEDSGNVADVSTPVNIKSFKKSFSQTSIPNISYISPIKAAEADRKAAREKESAREHELQERRQHEQDAMAARRRAAQQAEELEQREREDRYAIDQQNLSRASDSSQVFALAAASPRSRRAQSARVPMNSSLSQTQNNTNNSHSTHGGHSGMNAFTNTNTMDTIAPAPTAVDFGLLARTMSSLRQPTKPPPWGRPPSAPVSALASPRTSVDQSNDDEWEDLDVKAIEAAKWTDGEIRKLITIIKSMGQLNENGQHYVTFGVLFNETQNIFDALSGICKTAKKYNVVSFAPEQLWQGRHDHEHVTLLKDTHDGIEIKRRKKLSSVKSNSSLGFNRSQTNNATNKCHVCTKTVYPMEYLGASDKSFHKNCFRCFKCKHKLEQNNYFVGQDNNFRCQAHHREFEMSAF
eukprot:m.122504 g.122504  ORF g.122504 m.122504 type:complete len:529 (-) comp28926_c0_seq1:688-2274(-)